MEHTEYNKTHDSNSFRDHDHDHDHGHVRERKREQCDLRDDHEHTTSMDYQTRMIASFGENHNSGDQIHRSRPIIDFKSNETRHYYDGGGGYRNGHSSSQRKIRDSIPPQEKSGTRILNSVRKSFSSGYRRFSRRRYNREYDDDTDLDNDLSYRSNEHFNDNEVISVDGYEDSDDNGDDQSSIYCQERRNSEPRSRSEKSHPSDHDSSAYFKEDPNQTHTIPKHCNEPNLSNKDQIHHGIEHHDEDYHTKGGTENVQYDERKNRSQGSLQSSKGEYYTRRSSSVFSEFSSRLIRRASSILLPDRRSSRRESHHSWHDINLTEDKIDEDTDKVTVVASEGKWSCCYSNRKRVLMIFLALALLIIIHVVVVVAYVRNQSMRSSQRQNIGAESSSSPSHMPSALPIHTSSMIPSITPSISVSLEPSVWPSSVPSTEFPSILPSSHQSEQPSLKPSEVTSFSPSILPSVVHSNQPSFNPSSPPTIVASSPPSSNLRYAEIRNELVDYSGSDLFGRYIALSDDGNILAAMSSRFTENVTVYENINNTWNIKGSPIQSPNPGDFSYFGKHIAMSANGTIVAIGAPYYMDRTGMTQVFQWNGTDWAQMGQDLIGNPADGYNYDDQFGDSVGLSGSGTDLYVAAYEQKEDSGRIESFHFNGTTWNHRGNIIDTANDTMITFYYNAISMSRDGDYYAVGSFIRKWVKVFHFNGTQWEQWGSTLWNPAQVEYSFGAGVDIASTPAGVILAIGSPYEDATGVIRVYDYALNDTDWIERNESLRAPSWSSMGGLGKSIKMSDDGNSIIAASRDATVVMRYDWDGYSRTWTRSNVSDEVNYSDPIIAVSADAETIVASYPFDDVAFENYGLLDPNNHGRIRTYGLTREY